MNANIHAARPDTPSASTVEIFARQRAILFSVLLKTFFPVALAILLIWNLSNPAFDWARPLTVIIILIYVAVYRLSLGQHYRTGVVMLIVLLLATVLVVMSKAPRPYVERLPSLAFLSVAVFLASVLLSIRATIITLLISVSGIAWLLTINEIPFALIFSSLAFMFCVAILSIVSAYIQRNVLTELDQQKNIMAERETLFRELAEHSPDSILIIEPINHKLLYSNRAEFVGYPTTDPQFLADVRTNTHPDDLAAVDSYLQKLGDVPAKDGVEYRIKSKSGRWEWIHSRKAVISRSADASPEKVLICASIITDRKQEDLRQMEASLEQERVKILTNFIRDASHEFRTPLSTIITNLYILEQRLPSEADQALIEQIEQQSNSIATLVDAMTLLAKLSSDVTLELDIYPINTVIDESNIRANPNVIQHKHTVLTELTDPSPIVLADRKLLVQAFTQLIDNAAHHTDNGGTITVRTYLRDKLVILEVQDTGGGITDTALPHIFETFFRGDSAHTTAGFGLGLTLVKRIIERLNGKIEVETTHQTGSIFRIILPTHTSHSYFQSPTPTIIDK
jgi:PAS domain S-box-containing protein